MMLDTVTSELGQESISQEHQTLLEHCKTLVGMSRRRMKNYYDQWRRADAVYRCKLKADEEDRKANERKEPVKGVIPLTFSQVQTFQAFCYTLYTQREYIFELEAAKGNSRGARIGSALLERDLKYSDFRGTVLLQYLKDVGRYGLGVVKHSWHHDCHMMEVSAPAGGVSIGALEVAPQGQSMTMQSVTKFKGNKVVNVSPFRFFPDIRLPLTRFQEGEFAGYDEQYGRVDLLEMQSKGEVAGIDYVSETADAALEREPFLDGEDSAVMDASSKGKTKKNIIITEVQIKIIPNKFMMGGEPIGPEDYPIKYLVWIANDKRIVKLQPMGYLHNNFTYRLGQMDPDNEHLVSQGIAEILDTLQEVISWLVNSHIASVRKTISNWIIVDPSGIEMKDLHERRHVIRLKGSAARLGVDRWVRQLDVQDVTQGHIADSEAFTGMAQAATGISENMMGQFSPGRRSATEARSVNQAAAGRVKMIACHLWHSCLMPLADDMLSNLRDGLDEAAIVRVVGMDDIMDTDPMTGQPKPNQEALQFLSVTKNDLVEDTDFVIFDGTLPSEKGYIAQSLQEILTSIISNPVAAQFLGLDPRGLMKEIMALRGIRNLGQFTLPPQLAGPMWSQAVGGLMPPPPMPAGGPPGQPAPPPPSQ